MCAQLFLVYYVFAFNFFSHFICHFSFFAVHVAFVKCKSFIRASVCFLYILLLPGVNLMKDVTEADKWFKELCYLTSDTFLNSTSIFYCFSPWHRRKLWKKECSMHWEKRSLTQCPCPWCGFSVWNVLEQLIQRHAVKANITMVTKLHLLPRRWIVYTTG